MITHNKQTYRVVCCTPAGRAKYLSVFKPFIYRKMDEGLVDGWQLWQNTSNGDDLAYLASMESENPKVKIYRIGEPILTPTYDYAYGDFNPLKTYMFFANAHDDDTIYIRFDDDIVWCAEDAIEKMCAARIDHPDAFLIVPNTINSTLMTSWHQEIGALSEEVGRVKRYDKTRPDWAYLDEFNYSSAALVDLIHKTFRKHYEEGKLSAYYLPSKSMDEFQRFSICCICWWGKDKLRPGYIEEPQLSWELPIALNKPNFFVGDALVLHYSYHTQRKYLTATGDLALEFYKQINNAPSK